MIKEIIHEEVHGYFIPLDHPGIEILARHGVLGRYKSGKQGGYPEVFEAFWDSYHTERRGEKKNTYKEWLKLTTLERADLPDAAKAYTGHIILHSSPKYMKQPKMFIKSEAFKDYKLRADTDNMIKSLKFWDECIMKTAGFIPAWVSENKDLAIEDIKSLGSKNWNAMVWTFFFSKDQKILSQREAMGMHYKTFHAMLSKEMLFKNQPVTPCKYCGETGRHDKNCFIVQERKRKKAIEKKEYEDARGQEFNLKEAFENQVRSNQL